jgi:PAS domain S-box-containing protein
MRKPVARKASLTRRARGPLRGRSPTPNEHHRSFRVDPAFFGRVVESLAEYAVLTLDRDLNLTSWNAAAERIFGYTEQEVKGKPAALLFTPEDRQIGFPEREFDAALSKGRAEDERYHLAKGGRRFWSYGLSFPLTDGTDTIRGYVKIIRDESERKCKEDQLLEREERLRLAVEATGVGTWDYFPKTETLELSAPCKTLFGLPPDARVTYDLFLSRAHPEDRRTLDSAIHACLDGTSPVCDVQHRIVLPDASTRWVTMKARVVAVHCPDGKDTCPRLIGLVVDSTEAKDRMTRLMLANEELESFAYSASHDLRAPLRKISAYSQAIQEDHHDRLTDEGIEYFKRIQAAADHMKTLIDALLNLSLATRRAMSIETIDLSRMAGEIAEDLRSSSRERKGRFDIQAGVSGRGDRELLSAVLRNLLDNAWKFTKHRPEARIEFGAHRTSTGDVYFVRDNGAGFDMRQAKRLFHAFHRLHSAEEFPGTGVGLGIVHRIIRRHQGRVWAESRLGQGATFFFTLFTELDEAGE